METNSEYIKRIADEQIGKANNSKFKEVRFSVCDEPFSGCDLRAFELQNEIIEYIREKGHVVTCSVNWGVTDYIINAQ